MYPKQHAVVSGGAAVIAAVGVGVPPIQIALWAAVGIIAGVLIDVDHAVLSMLMAGRVDEGVYWFRHPVQAVIRPDAFLADMEYDGLVFHRLVSHVLVFTVLLMLVPVHPLVLPAVVGLGVHILADILWNWKQGLYGA